MIMFSFVNTRIPVQLLMLWKYKTEKSRCLGYADGGPQKGCSTVSRRFCCDVPCWKTASQVTKQRFWAVVWDARHVVTVCLSKSITMVPCQIPVNYEIAVPNSMTLGTGWKWLYNVKLLWAWRALFPWRSHWRFSHTVKTDSILRRLHDAFIRPT